MNITAFDIFCWIASGALAVTATSFSDAIMKISLLCVFQGAVYLLARK